MKGFLADAVPYIFLGVLAFNLLYITGLMAALSSAVGPIMSSLFGLPKEAVIALMLGFLRKDFAVGMLAPIPMTPMQLTVASTLLVTFAPCLATLTVMYRELGLAGFVKSMAFMAAMTMVTGVLMRIVLL